MRAATDEPPPSRRGAFWKSPHHAALGLLTLAAGFATGEPLYLIAGATAYVLGWIYLPDMPLFRLWLEKKSTARDEAAANAEIAAFAQRRDTLLASLAAPARERYAALARVCRDIETAAAETGDPAADPRLRQLDELMWMFLRLLSLEQALEEFLATEHPEDLAASIAEAGRELAALDPATNERLYQSRAERLDTLRKREARTAEARNNLALVRAEQDRLAEQIKLIRADAVATRNADALSARITASVAHLDETNRWLAEMSEFQSLTGDLPLTPHRLGFESQRPPPLPAERRTSSDLRQKRERQPQ